MLPSPAAGAAAHRKGDRCPLLPPRPRRRPLRRRLSAAQQQFALAHLNLARQQARLFAIRHDLTYEDVLGAAYEGLCKAALDYNPGRGHRPSIYVVPKLSADSEN